MKIRSIFRISLACCAFASIRADVTGCLCNPADPVSLENRACSLTREAIKQPAGTEVFFLRDTNPRKPNRWLALPVGAGPGFQFIEQMPKANRLMLWQAAVRKAEELFGADWALAYNGVKVRTQCHFHIHMGRFIKAAEQKKYRVIRSLSEIPVDPGKGVWIHPVDKNRYHVHTGEEITETALVR